MERLQHAASVAREPVEKFIDTFCDPKAVKKDFKNALGPFTPCFTDIVILGLAHLSVLIFVSLRIAYLRSPRTRPKYHVVGTARFLKFTSVVAAVACPIIILAQINARMGSNPETLLDEKIAPFEWLQYLLCLVSWALFLTLFVLELDSYSRSHTWMGRFPILFVCAGEVAKLRTVIIISEHKDYFFWLYIAYFAIQGWIGVLALFWYPSIAAMTPLDPADDWEYEELRAEEQEKICPEATAGLYNAITFGWISPLMVKGFKKPLQFEDIWELPPDDRVGKVASRFESHWEKELQRREGPSLTRACWRTTRGLIGWAIPFKLINDASQFVAPISINALLGVVERGESSALGYLFACLMFVGLEVGTICDNQHFQRTMRAGFRLRALLVHEVFKKVLFLTPGAQHHFTSGRIFNLVTSDAETLQQLCQNLLGVVSSPARIIGAVALLYVQLGPASLVALVTLVVMMPIQAFLVRISARLMRKSLQFTDERSKLEGELLNGMDVVKCSAWEDSFWDRIQGVRNTELGVLWKSAIVSCVNSFLLNSIPVIVSVATFAAYVLLGNNLSASKAFTALSLFTVLRMPLFQLPQLVTQLVNARVALKRLEELLAADQQPPIPMLPAAESGDEAAIKLEGDFAWDDDVPPTLHGVSLSIRRGSLTAIVGSTGSGKTSVLSAALGLMNQASGPTVEVRGKVAFVPQAAFIFGASVRDNILFGLPFDESRYRSAVQAAALGPDLVQLPAGDMTELGERGVNVSGGQKQRISIARAVYSGSDIVLLDDPLSALDAKVAREVYNGCVRGVLRERTRVLVTNQLQFVSGSELVLFMADGRVAEAGTYGELMRAGKGFAQLMKQAEVEQESEETTDSLDEKPQAENATALGPQKAGGAKKSGEGGQGHSAEPETRGTLTQKEGRATGRVSLAVLAKYVRAMGGFPVFVLLMSLFLLIETARIGTTLWLSFWTGSADRPGGAPHPALWYLGIYSAISGGQITFQLLSTFLMKGLSLTAAKVLHNKMLAKLLRAPMSFFHTTPAGRLINRLTKDTSDIDKNLADFATFFLRSALQLVSTVVLIGVITPFALSALVPILLCFYLLYAYFQASVREVKRLDAISRSPVYSSIGEELAGLATIRAYRAEGRLIERNAGLIDRSVIFSLANQSMNRWLSVRLETLGGLSALAAAVLTVEQRGAASVFGLVLSYALQITILTSITVRLASLVENNFNAVERVAEYSEIQEEAALQIDGSKPDDWPSNGQIDFDAVKMRYRPGLPLVLRGLSVRVEPRSRVGVVGRTGAGKSSLINCLFRLMELDSGRIVIDGVDIAALGLHQLRSAMSLIPQTPVLFTGTLRSNLTPFGEHSDADCWAALRRAHLAGMVESTPAGLDMELAEGGAPLSAGQKQLVAMARALLRHSKVICLDEATASIDTDTDALIQHTINEEFAQCTIVIIAHRLHTIIDADRVLVMDHGEAAEFAAPAELLRDHEGVFATLQHHAGMVRETGDGTARLLHSIANGEIDSREGTSAQAKRAMSRVAETPPPQQSWKESAVELLERARETHDSVEHSLALLSEHKLSEEFRRNRSDVEPLSSDDASAVNEAIQQALDTLSTIKALAAKVNRRFQGSATTTPRSPPPPPPGPGYGAVPLAGSAVGNELGRRSAEVARSPAAAEAARHVDWLLTSHHSAPLDGPGGRRSSTEDQVPEGRRPPLMRSKTQKESAIKRRMSLSRSFQKPRKSQDYARLANEDPSISSTSELH